MAELRWWLLRLDSTGKVLSCTPVDHAERNGDSWVYIQAADAKAAQRAAMNAYMRDVMRKRRARLIAEGKCAWCGRANRKNAKAAGKPVPQLDRKVAIAARRDEERQQAVASAVPSVRLQVLQEVMQAWQDEPTNGAFTRWLTNEIEAAGGKRRAG